MRFLSSAGISKCTTGFIGRSTMLSRLSGTQPTPFVAEASVVIAGLPVVCFRVHGTISRLPLLSLICPVLRRFVGSVEATGRTVGILRAVYALGVSYNDGTPPYVCHSDNCHREG